MHRSRPTWGILAVIIISLLGTACQATPATTIPATSTPAGAPATATQPAPTEEPTVAPTEKPTIAPTDAPAVSQELVIGLGRNLYYGPSTWYVLHGSVGVWEPLVILDNEMHVKPVLATDWEMNDDGTVWTFHLRQGVTFHDGTPFDAEAVLLNVPVLQEEYDKTLPNLSSLEKIDDYTVQFITSEPTPNLPQLIAFFSSAMMSPAAVGEDGRLAAPVGTGPFQFVEYVEGDSIIIERNDAYWGEPAKLDKVTFKYIPDATTRLAALQTGEIDAIADVGALQPEQAAIIEADENLVLLQQGVATTHYLTFKSDVAPFDDVRLRQAVSMALDRQSLVDHTLFGYGEPGVSVITTRAQDWVRTDVAPAYDMETAMALAEEALQGERVEARLVLNSGLLGRWPYENIAQILQATIADLGIDVTIDTLEGGAWSAALKAGEYDVTMMPYTLMTGDPDFFVSNWALSDGSLNVARSYGYSNSHVDELVASAITELDPATRKAQYDELQGILAEEIPFTPLYHELTLYATRNNVHDLYLDVQFKPSIEIAYKTPEE